MKQIEKFPDYAVTEDGNVWSYKSNKFLKQTKDRLGYIYVELSHNGKHYRKTVHRLVATTFINNDDIYKTDINHIDGNKENNNVSNLEWLSHADNMKHGWKNGLFDKVRTRCQNTGRVNGKKIRCIETGEIFPSISAAARKYGLSVNTISVCLIKNKTTKNGVS